jgi:hypothetical protein
MLPLCAQYFFARGIQQQRPFGGRKPLHSFGSIDFVHGFWELLQWRLRWRGGLNQFTFNLCFILKQHFKRFVVVD